MLACVSTLRNISSYESVRDRKAWLTTNEAIDYIVDHCPALKGFLYFDSPYSQLLYSRLYSLSEEVDSIQWRTCENHPKIGEYKIAMRRVCDNGCRRVRFFNRESIQQLEAAKQKRNKALEEWNNRRELAKKIRKACLNSYYARQSSNYCEYAIKEAPWGTFYDPEWFG